MSKKKFYVTYTALFAVLFFLCFQIYLLLYHKSILRYWDAFDQQYLLFAYLGKWIRTAITTFKFPVWEHSIGYGADFFLTMWGTVCDPVYWISALVPERYAEFGYNLLVVIKLYLAGISFSVFGFRRGLKPYSVLCGALVYTFCACAYTGIYQSYFINPLYLFPLLICGADELFAGKRSVLYVLSLTYFAITSFYLTYMAGILLVIYVLIKWLSLSKESKKNLGFARILLRFVIFSFWSACISAVALVPIALLMLDMDRLDLVRYVPLFYDKGFYANMYKGFIASYDMQGRDCKIGFSVLALIGVFALFIGEKGKYRALKIEFLLMSLGLCIPFVGHVMNGFGYVANRWIWAYALLVSYIVAVEMPNLKTADSSKLVWITILSGVYIFCAYEFFRANSRLFNCLSVELMIVCLLSVLFHTLTQEQFEKIIITVTCISVLLPSFYNYSERYGNEYANHIQANEAYSRARGSGGLPLLDLLKVDDGSRYNRTGLSSVRNASWLYGVGGMDFYMSYYNNGIDQFHNSIALKTSPWSFGYDGLDRRSELLPLLGVNHFFAQAGYSHRPVSFDIPEAETDGWDGRIQSWTSEKPYSLFTVFDKAVSYEDYDALSPYDRQQLLMNAVAVEDVYSNSKLSDFELGNHQVDYYVESARGLEYSDQVIKAKESEAKLIIRFNEQHSDCEASVFLENIHFKNGLDSAYNISVYGLIGENWIDYTYNSYDGLNNIHHMYGGKHNWLLNLGPIEGVIDGVCIVFHNPGEYHLDGISVYSKPVTEIEKSIQKLEQNAQNVRLSPNKVSFEIENTGDQFLFASIPYSDGWRATVDGKSAEIMKADVGFMALKLPAGEHSVVFIYHTPGILAGFLISAISIIGYVFFCRKNRRSNRNQAGSLA